MQKPTTSPKLSRLMTVEEFPALVHQQAELLQAFVLYYVPLPQHCKGLHTVQDCFCRRQVVLWVLVVHLVLVVLIVHWVLRGTVTLQQCSIVVRAVLDSAMQISGVLLQCSECLRNFLRGRWCPLSSVHWLEWFLRVVD